MMDQISSWLRGIILVLLFATFMDLLLPGHKYSRAVKMATGLVIILAMLTPVLSILGGEISTESLLKPGPVPQSASLDSILAKGRQIGEQQMAQTEDEWKRQMQTYVAKQVEALFPVTVSNVEVSLDFASEQSNPGSGGNPKAASTPKIQSIRLYVAKRPANSGAASSSNTQGSTTGLDGGIKPVEPVAPITIDGGNQTDSAGAPRGGGSKNSDPAMAKISRDIKSQLATWFEVSPAAIEVYWS